MKLPSPPQQQQQLESAAEIVLPQQRRSSAVLSRMLSSSSHCGDSVLPYAAAAGRRAAVLLDHRRYHHGRPSVVEVAPSCPRCDSPNTKFCYYNNYSLSQPRYFCKACRRYWTKGGSLRNVPVGGGCRKNRRSRTLRAPLHAVDAGNSAASGGGPAASSLAAAAMLRPDLLLDGMVSSPAGLCRSMDDAAERPAVTSEGSTIDLALLYAKFLNQQPAPERGGAVLPEPIDTLSGSSSSDMSPVAPPRDPLPFATAAEPCAAAAPPPLCPDDGGAEAALRELGFCVGQSCYDYDSLGLPQDGGDLVLLPSAWHPGAKYEPFDALPEDAVSLQDGIGAGGDVWNTALACQGLEAALCTP